MKNVWMCFLLAACAASPPVLEPVTVDIPVPVACKTTAVAKPDFALAHVTAAQTLAEKTKAALIELDQRKAYETNLESQLTFCE